MSYILMKVPALKEELKKRSASTRGRKADLIERLESYDRNHNFGQESVEFVDPSIPDWPESGFRQLTSAHKDLIGRLTKVGIEIYFQHQQVSYNYKLRVDTDPTEIRNSHCECPSGRGPNGTCKHIAAILSVLVTFGSEGKLNIPHSCTDELQKFHRPPKMHTGSPVKAQDLKLQSKRCEINLDDPRPHKFRNVPGYQDHVRNSIINYVSQTGEDIALRYLYEHADLQTAQLDHDYLSLPFLEHWVDSRNSVTPQQATDIEKKTRKQAKSKDWRCERAWRLTASNFGQICRVTERRNLLKLSQSMLNSGNFFTAAIQHGRQYESVAIAQFEEREDVEVHPCGLCIREDYPYLGATPDGRIDKDTIVEVKCPYTGRNKLIAPGKMFKFLRSTADGLVLNPNHHYYYQVQGQLFISKSKICYFIVYTFKDMKVLKVELDEQYCLGSLIPKLQCFYERVYRKHITSTF